PAAGVEHQRCFGLADYRWQCDREAKAGVKAQSREVGAKARLWAGHAEVSHHRKAQATTDSCSMYRCDNWFFGTKQSIALDIKWRDTGTGLVRPAALRVERRTVAEISTGAKRFALGCHDDGPNVDVVIEVFESIGNLFDQWYVEKIVRRAPDLDQRDAITLFDPDITHRVCPSLGGVAAFCVLQSALNDQGVHHGDAFALAVHNHGIEIDFSDVVRMIECE